MVNFEEQPEEWVALVTELDDAREHLQNMIDQMVLAKSIETEDFSVQMGHIYAHLNRSWYCRNGAEYANEGTWDEASAFPADLQVCG